MTATQKILAQASGRERVVPGEEVVVRPDFSIAYEFPGYTDRLFQQLEQEFDVTQVPDPDRLLIFIDHLTTNASADEERAHSVTRHWAQRNGVRVYEGYGIGHQVVTELGHAVPGRLLVHFDGHISGVGALGALGLGVRRDLIEPWLTGRLSLEVPESVALYIEGAFARRVSSRDLVHHLIRSHGADGFLNQVLEMSSPTGMRIDERQTICTMAMFTGAVSALFWPDQEVADYLRSLDRHDEPVAGEPDPDAQFAAEYAVKLPEVEPLVVLPGSARAANTIPVNEVGHVSVQRGFIGSCASGRLEDLREAAELLQGRSVAPDFVLTVVPTSEAILRQAADAGYLRILEEAGAVIGKPSCDFCFGYASPLESEDACISTGVLNITGRMGSPTSEIFMGSAFTVAASAVVGQIVDPREMDQYNDA